MITEIREMRRSAARALATVLAELKDTHPSEVALRDAWHERLVENPVTCPEGWYIPPPHGIVLAVGNPPLFNRVNTPTFRPEPTWPSPHHRLNRESLLFVYSSRIHQVTGAIGDIGCSLYRGGSPAIQDHLSKIWDVTARIAEEVRLGIILSQLYSRAMNVISENKLTNNIYSAHDGDDTNIGHTIAWSNERIPPHERRVLAAGEAEQVAQLVSNKRRFINRTESLEITEDLVLTIEPRLSAPGLPPACFHVIVGFERGHRVVITEFEPLFDVFEMNYLLY
jgi:hypothetical protein